MKRSIDPKTNQKARVQSAMPGANHQLPRVQEESMKSSFPGTVPGISRSGVF
jgi:hypothetical protein